MDTDDRRNSTNSAAQRSFALLEALAAADRPLGVAELVERLGLPKPTVHRLALQLEAAGLLLREPNSKRYGPGHRLRDLALHVLGSNTLMATRRAILQQLAERIGETCNMTILDGNGIVYFDRVETNWPIRVHLPPGSRLPLHCTASGKLFLARMTAARRKRLLETLILERRTDHTLTDHSALDKALQRIAEEDVGTDEQELIDGMVAVAVPILDRNDRICATLAVHAPILRRNLADLRRHVPLLREAAAALASELDQAAFRSAAD